VDETGAGGYEAGEFGASEEGRVVEDELHGDVVAGWHSAAQARWVLPLKADTSGRSFMVFLSAANAHMRGAFAGRRRRRRRKGQRRLS
jgi:hypothetical protein